MNINLKAWKIELPADAKEYILEKIGRLEKYLGRVKAINCDVEIKRTVGSQQSGEIYQAIVNLELPGKILRVEKVEKELLKAVDKVKDHLVRAIDKYKEHNLR
ncbi:ribosomal subunit interface protein [Candidatus Falkowbacteria bacterium CG_4_10_14_0_2_um_filter_48_10]|uniref:Ribosomal subunit interface protein n=1 Tax=Candidatus Falkowbacteria bacterium CG23_combo_of_CG06-09_8_20_14_all_49_15 TaxID=1974572 RepID=A0A2G9ZL14_9BACT|nr:MAG: ribosomal subunit interface protein [Candidatus Falkowbacteria bacterium CG23_combo_of_CG06-09_8_20_14_all_49_15]PJA07764.1 MAG: ribosomal subunit interface protein [Candidatus Falkowbacteria bacterium CG_4_10_14_0_2_um_filter_48_10]